MPAWSSQSSSHGVSTDGVPAPGNSASRFPRVAACLLTLLALILRSIRFDLVIEQTYRQQFIAAVVVAAGTMDIEVAIRGGGQSLIGSSSSLSFCFSVLEARRRGVDREGAIGGVRCVQGMAGSARFILNVRQRLK